MRAKVSPRLTRYTSGGDFLSSALCSGVIAGGAAAVASAAGALAAGTLDAAAAAVCASCWPTFAQPLTASATHTPARLAIFVLSKRFPILFDSCLVHWRAGCHLVACDARARTALCFPLRHGKAASCGAHPCPADQPNPRLHKLPDARDAYMPPAKTAHRPRKGPDCRLKFQ